MESAATQEQGWIAKLNGREEYREVLIFLIKLVAIYLFWRTFMLLVGDQIQPLDQRIWPWLSSQWEHFNDLVRGMLLWSTGLGMGILGYETEVVNDYVIRIIGTGGIAIGNYCLAVQLMVLFVALIISFPGGWLKKLWFLPMGILLIQVLNTGRMVALTLLSAYAPQYMEFNHYFTFRVIVFAVIVGLYAWYVKKIA